jgi:hypothetical protein
MYAQSPAYGAPPAYGAHSGSQYSQYPSSAPPSPHSAQRARGHHALNAAATSQAWKNVGIAAGGFVLSLLILAIGAATGILLLIGIPLFLIALIALPITIWRLFDPTKYGTLASLGRTSEERRYHIDYADADISQPYAWTMRCGGGTLFMTPHFLVYKGSSLEIVRAEDVVWWWEKNVTSGRILRSTKPYVCVKTRQSHKFEMEVYGSDGHVMAALARAYPHAFSGYSPQLESCSGQQLAQEVDRRRSGAAAYYGA